MKKIIIAAAFISALLTALTAGLYQYDGAEIFLTLTITAGTTAYHLIMRLLVGAVVNLVMKNTADYNGRWYHTSAFEERIYRIIKVKKWKAVMPSYDPDQFSTKKHSLDEIAQAMCQSELVHEVIVVMSFLPLLGALKFGAFPVFLMTSIAAAAFDLLFVIMQRYNRPRIIKASKRQNIKTHHN